MYFTMKDALQHAATHTNIKVIWFEEMKHDLNSVVKDLEDFVGYKVPHESRQDLLQHMHIDSFRKNDAVNMKPPPGKSYISYRL